MPVLWRLFPPNKFKPQTGSVFQGICLGEKTVLQKSRIIDINPICKTCEINLSCRSPSAQPASSSPLSVSQDDCDLPHSSKKRTRVKKRRYEDDSSEEEPSTRRSSGACGMATRYKETPTPPFASRHSGEGSAAKRRRMTTRNQPDLTFCE